MAKQFFWKVWLKLNLLTKNMDNDYIAEVSTVGKTLHNADIARAFEESGSELQFETLLDILDRADRICREKLQEGYSMQNGVCHISPRVTGNWVGATATYNPGEHKVTLDIFPTAEMRAALEEVGIEVLGIRDSGAFIGLVTDVTTGSTDGTLTTGGQIIIAGEKIKIESDAGDISIGVFLADEDMTYQVTSIAVNHPKEIIAALPDIPKGDYALYIVTRYAGGNTLLKERRRLNYGTAIKII